MGAIPIFQKTMQVGLGEAIGRVNRLHSRVTGRVASPAEVTEHNLLMDALNEIKIDLGFDCDNDGIPDTIEVFARTAQTSCCRLIPSDSVVSAPKRSRTTTSRTTKKPATRKTAPKKKPARTKTIAKKG